MRRWMTSFATLGLLAPALAAPALAVDVYKVDPAHSFILFRAKHAGVAYAYGRFNKFSGQFALDGTAPDALAFEVNATSIDTGIDKRDQHLRGPDFFNAAQFPTIRFRSTSIRKAPDGRYEVAGELTLHGVSRPVVASLEVVGTGQGMQGKPIAGFEAVMEFKRSDFEMTNMIPAISDEVRVIVSVEGVKS